jgi:hypothetical protein
VPEATTQLFTALHGLGISMRWYEYAFGFVDSFSLEIVSTKQTGIRFLLRTPKSKANTIRQSITSYVPDVKVKETSDYEITKRPRITMFKQTKHFAFPLANHETLESHDPIGYLTAAMTKLKASELMSFQLVITPIRSRQAERLREKILSNEDLLSKLGSSSVDSMKVTTGINNVLFGVTDLVSGAYHGASKTDYYAAQKELDYQKQVAKRTKPVRTLSYFEHELVSSIHQKLSQPLFKTDIRLLVSTSSKQTWRDRGRSVQSALSLFSVPKYQSLKSRKMYPQPVQRLLCYAFAKRLPAQVMASNVLAASELAGLYHFPNTKTAKTENIVKSLSRTLPAPVALKNGSNLDILLGSNEHHGSYTPIGLTADERQRHVYIIGGTGNGKTTMLLYSYRPGYTGWQRHCRT